MNPNGYLATQASIDEYPCIDYIYLNRDEAVQSRNKGLSTFTR